MFVQAPSLKIPKRSKWRKRNVCCSALSDSAILSIDVGSSSTKAALVDCTTGSLRSHVSRVSYPMNTAREFHATQKKEDWKKAVFKSSSSVLQRVKKEASIEVVAIAVTGQMQSLIGINSPPPLLADDAILYCDSRAIDNAASLSQRLGTTIRPTDLLAKLALLDPPPCVGDTYSLLLGAADYAISILGGQVTTDPTNLSTTGLSCYPHRSYNSHLITRAGLDSFLPLLPKIQSTLSPCGVLSSDAALELGFPDLAGIKLVHAGGDAATATFGAGIMDLNDASEYIYIGTSGWAGSVVSFKEENVSAQSGLFYLAHPHDENIALKVGSLATAGWCLEHVSNEFLGGIPLETMDSWAAHVPIGAGGLTYVPYIDERRCPNPRSGTTGGLFGMNRATTRKHIAAAAIQGVAHALRDCLDSVRAGNADKNPIIRVCGGASRSDSLLRAITGSSSARIIRGAGSEVGLIGAASAAAVSLGIETRTWWENGQDEEEMFVPQEDEIAEWDESYKRFQAAVGCLEQFY